MKTVTYMPQARKTLKKMDAKTSKRVQDKIDLLACKPEALKANIKKLANSPYYRLRVGDWRVIYMDDLTIVSIVTVSPRGGAY